MRIYDMRTEHLQEPLGLDSVNPRFSWKIQGYEKNRLQAAYRVKAFSDYKGSRLLWDSGRVPGRQTTGIVWGGVPLQSGQRVYWKAFSEFEDCVLESGMTWFEMGLLSAEDWKAEWITDREPVLKDEFQPALYLRKTFFVRHSLKRARIYQSSHGLYEFFINGKRGTRDVFKPGFTSYELRLQYQAYDITSLLRYGENCWAVILADGWWRGTTGGCLTNNFGYRLAFGGMLVLEYSDGTSEVVSTDESFRYSSGGLLQCDLKQGEIFDARKEPDNWKLADFPAEGWKEAACIEKGSEITKALIASRSVPVREQEVFDPEILHTPDGNTVLDFGQNIAGYVKMKLRGGRRGTRISLTHGEALDKQGNFTMENLYMLEPGELCQKVIYIKAGEDEEIYQPISAVFGFRYVLLEGVDWELEPGDFSAVAVYSDLQVTGKFTCSDHLVSQLVKNSLWSQKGNFLDVPTDCPQRERSPWTGDVQIYIETACSFMDVYPFLAKWLQDLAAEQLSDGKVTNTVPAASSYHNYEEYLRIKEKCRKEGIENWNLDFLTGYAKEGCPGDGSAGWGDAAVIVPYVLYLYYGDRKILAVQYPSAKKWVDYIRTQARKRNPLFQELPYYEKPEDAEYVWDTGFHWGEWLEVGSDVDQICELKERPDYLTATMYFYYSSYLLASMAEILGRKEDYNDYRSLSEKIKAVFNRYFISEDGMILEGKQAPYVRALAFHLVEESKEKQVVKRLVDLVIQNAYKLNTGFLSTKYLLAVLSDHGYTDVAYRVLLQKEEPGWLCNVEAGATTIPEMWNGYRDRVGSFNHYSYGAVCDFLFSRIAGIRPQKKAAGFERFTLMPRIDDSLDYASAEYECVHGKIRSAWYRNGQEIVYCFAVPVNTTADVFIEGDEKQLKKWMQPYGAVWHDGMIRMTLGSGIWTFAAAV
nr:alpha-L-rhamnosidase [uncultured Schaedlerella sp.]